MSVPRTFVEKDQFVEKEKIRQLIEEWDEKLGELHRNHLIEDNLYVRDVISGYINQMIECINQLKQLIV